MMEGPLKSHSYQVYRFKGSKSSFIDIPKQANLDMAGLSCTYLMYIYVSGKNDCPLLEYIYPEDKVGFHLGLYPKWYHMHFHSSYRSQTFECFKNRTWHFFGFTYNQTSEKLTYWRDGELFKESTFSATNWKMNGFIRLGMRKGAIYFDGSIACLMIYAEVLTAGEIKEARTQCLSTLTKGNYFVHFKR